MSRTKKSLFSWKMVEGNVSQSSWTNFLHEAYTVVARSHAYSIVFWGGENEK